MLGGREGVVTEGSADTSCKNLPPALRLTNGSPPKEQGSPPLSLSSLHPLHSLAQLGISITLPSLSLEPCGEAENTGTFTASRAFTKENTLSVCACV